MDDGHLTVAIIRLWLREKLSAEELLKLLLPHTITTCHTCQRAWIEATRGQIPGAGLFRDLHHAHAGGGLSQDEAIEKALESVTQMRNEVFSSPSLEAVEKNLQCLLELAPGHRMGAIERSRSKYTSPQLAAALLKLSRKCAGYDPRQSEEFACLAEAVVRRARKKEVHRAFAIDLHALSVALQGNSYRIRGRYDRATELLGRAHAFLDHGSGDPVVFGDILSLDASLLLDRYRHEEAEETIRRAMKIFRRCDEAHRIGKAAMQLAVVQEDAGDPGKAVASLREALQFLDLKEEPHLEHLVYKDLAFYVCEAGEPHRGLEILHEHPMPSEAPRYSRLKWEWIEARIQSALGLHAEAAVTFSILREEFLREESVYCAAMASLDLSLSFSRQGYASEVRRVAAESFLLLQEVALPEEISAALILFKQAADAEKATLSVLQSVQKTIGDYRLWRKQAAEH